MSTITNTPSAPENPATPPPKRYAKRNQILLLGIYFTFIGILLLQNVYSFWPRTVEVTKDKTLLLAENAEKIKRLKEDLKTSVSIPDSLQFLKAIEHLDSIRIGLMLSQGPDTSKISQVSVRLLFHPCKPFPVDQDQGLLLLVLIMGAVGSWLHAVSSFLDFVGNRNFVTSWFTWYLMRPILGSIMAVVFYVVIRAGLFPQSAVAIDAINPFSIAALAGLVGLFTQRASKKLADVFDALFPTAQKDKDPLEAKLPPAVITQFTPDQLIAGTTDLIVQVLGSNFTDKSTVFVGNQARSTKVTDSENLQFTLEPTDVEKAGTLQITIYDPALGVGAAESKSLVVVDEEAG